MHPSTNLESVIRDIDRHVSRDGWQQPPRLFALVPDDNGYKVVEQAWDCSGEDLVADLAAISWGPEVAGAAISVQRIVEPDHDARVTSGALRDQTVATALRYRTHDDEGDVAVGSGIMPRLERAMWDTLQD